MAESAVQELSPNSLHLSLAQPIAEIAIDQLAQAEATRFIKNIGSLAINSPETNLDFEPIKDLDQAIKLAAIDPVAQQMVETNVKAEALEQTLKAGHITKANLQFDSSLEIYQHNQTLRSINANALLLANTHSQMRHRLEAETLNTFILQRLFRQGKLEDKSFVVFSLVPDNMTTEEIDKVGFFTETMSLNIQVVTVSQGQLQLETAFIAGVKDRNGSRHDIAAVKLLARELGLNFDDLSVTEILASPLLIDNQYLPDGAINLVEMLDQAIDEVTGSNDTFFGQANGKQDYIKYKAYCEQREAQFIPSVEAATTELISQAASINSSIEAIQRLHKITEKHMVLYALTKDKSIDPWVFGSQAAPHILMARWHIENGNIDQAKAETVVSLKLADSRSCPSGLINKDTSSGDRANSVTSSEDCSFVSKECPICHKKNVRTTISRIGKKSYIRGSCGCSKID